MKLSHAQIIGTSDVDGEVVVFKEAMEPALPEQGEKRLLAAVLLDAMNHYAAAGKSLAKRKNGRWFNAKRVKEEVEAWMNGGEAAIPFEFLCEHLRLDPDSVRRKFATAHGSHQVTNVRRRRW